MIAEFELTKDDLTAFNLFHNAHSPTARRLFYRSLILPPAIWLLFCIGLWYLVDQKRGTPLRTFLDLLPLFCGVPVYLLFFPWLYRRKTRRIVAAMVSEGENKSLFGWHRVSITADAVTAEHEFGTSSASWESVEKVVTTDDYLYIYINALAAIIVPRRAFGDTSDFDGFVTAAANYRANWGQVGNR